MKPVKKIHLLYCSVALILLQLSCTKASISEELPLQRNPIDNQAEDSEMEDISEDTTTPASSNTAAVYELITQMQHESGLLESAAFTNFVSLYDNALAAIVFIDNGDLDKAEKIFDFFEGRQETELLMGSGGFYQSRNTEGNNGARTWMGDNAWLLIALNHYHNTTRTGKYDILAENLENWFRSLQDETGGLSGGFNSDGSEIPMVTEGIITAFNAVEGYDSFHSNIINFLKNERWDEEHMLLVASPDTPRYNFALDLHSLGFNIFPNFPETVLQEADRYKTTQTATVSGMEVTGYCFDEDKDVVWLEGTAQMAVAFNEAHLTIEAEKALAEIEKTFINSTASSTAHGIPYAANFGTSYGALPLWDHADTTPALSSGIWYVFAKTGLNPFALGKDKDIPEEDLFWTTTTITIP